MSILVDRDTRLLVQGITGREGEFHARQMLDYGTQVVAGVTPGKGGQLACDGRVPVFDTVAEAVAGTGANASAVYVPARSAAEAIFEATDAGLPLVVCITEGIPVQDAIRVCAYLQRCSLAPRGRRGRRARGPMLRDSRTRLIGPNCPGLLTPGQAKVGIMPGAIAVPGPVGVVSRSGTLTYEVVAALTARGIGQSTCVGIGGDPVIGTTFVDVLEMFEADPATEQVVLIGEIGGSDEERAARYIKERMSKPVVAFVAGRTAPAGRRMGHAGAIVEGGAGTAVGKIGALEAVGVRVVEYPEQIPDLISGVA